MMMKSVFWWRKPEYPEETTDLRQVTDETATYRTRYIPNFETIAEPLRRLTRKNVKYTWTEAQESAFNTLKDRLSSSKVLVYFNKDAHTQVIADASPVGLGAVLVQQHTDCNFRPVYYAVKSLTYVERRYSQTEQEALALVWACERFKLYLLGKDFELLTDHKPLELIYSPKSRPSARIERWVLRLQPFTFKVKYIPGKMNVADVLSRLSAVTSSPSGNGEMEDYVMSLTQSAVPRTMSAREIEKASKVDSELQVLRQAIASGDFSGCDTAYRAIKDELTTTGYIVLRQSHIIIPEKLRGEVLTLAHQGHQGAVKTKARLREKVWWPGMDRQCETVIKRCHECQVASLPNQPEPIEATPMPDGPWQDLALDFLGPFPTGEHILVVVDYYSRYFLVKLMRKITAETLITAMEESIELS